MVVIIARRKVQKRFMDDSSLDCVPLSESTVRWPAQQKNLGVVSRD
jgi:hypothetical protein